MAKLAATAARYQALLAEALSLARKKARGKPKVIRAILATGTAEVSGKGRDRKYAVVTYRAAKYKRTWLSLIEWRYLDQSSAPEWADRMIDLVEANVRMTETNSWPKPPARRSRRRKQARRAPPR
jgi:hypothetical protein